ncbi:aminoacyltransferase [Eubacteriales bacterium OttesenSCG-928-N14]|nr:aminoacyltransferase [Eubacteriales bacterium OttesenSCG-928-N14]
MFQYTASVIPGEAMQQNEQLAAQYDAFVSTHPNGHLFQSRLWSQVKQGWVSDYIIVRDSSGRITGTLCVRSRKLSPLPVSLLYASRGPVCNPNDIATLNAIVEQLGYIAKRRNALTLRMDPNVPASNGYFSTIMQEMGFALHNDYCNFEGVQARFVRRIDLRNQTEDEIFAQFSKKHRYGVRNAQRKGIEIRIGGYDDIPAFYELMKQTALRGNFGVRSMEYFQNVYRALGDNSRLLLAYDEGKCVATAWISLYAGLGHYLYGASATEGRQNMPTYLLQWEALRYMLANGAHTYDLRGVPGNPQQDDPLYGLYHFKKGFGGQSVELVGELDLVFKPVFTQVFDGCNHVRKKLLHANASHANRAAL